MKKSILTIVLAAMMLLAFTACNDQVTYKVPVGMTAEASKTEYLVGETFDPSTVTITVDYSDGSSRTMSGTDVGMASGKFDAAGYVSIPVEYGTTTSAGTSKLTASVSVIAYSVEKATVSSLPATGTFSGNEVTIDDSAVSVAVSYNNGQGTRTLAAGEFEVKADITTPAAGKQDANVSLEVFGKSVTAVTPDTWEITLTKETKAPGTYDPEKADGMIVRLSYVDADGETQTANGTSSSAASLTGTFYVNDVINWEVYLIDEDDNVQAAVEGTDYWFQGAEPASKAIELGEDNLTAAKDYTVVLSDNTTVKFTIPQAKDYVTRIGKITPKADFTSVSSSVSKANYDFEVEFASGKKEGTKLDGNGSNVIASGTVTPGTTYIQVKILDDEVPAGDAFYSYTPRIEVSFGKPETVGTALVLPEQIITNAVAPAKPATTD